MKENVIKKGFKLVKIIMMQNDVGIPYKEIFPNADELFTELFENIDVRYGVVDEDDKKMVLVPFMVVPISFDDNCEEITKEKIWRVRKKEPVIIIEDPFAKCYAKKMRADRLVAFPEFRFEIEKTEDYKNEKRHQKKRISAEDFKILSETPSEEPVSKVEKILFKNIKGFIELAGIIKRTQEKIKKSIS